MRVCSVAFLLIAMLGCGGVDENHSVRSDAKTSVRQLNLHVDGRWIGNAISYGPHRDGQRPGVSSPSAAEMREDLELMLRHWNLLRVYSSSEFSESLLAIIREEQLDMKVMLGAWIAVEERRDSTGAVTERFPEAIEANQREVDAAIRLANAYPDVVVAVSVGNETQIYWSGHHSPLDILIGHVQHVRDSVSVPVTVVDDFNYWNKADSRELAAELDFIGVNAHPMWNGAQLEGALAWLEQQVATIDSLHSDREVVVAETGWATSALEEGLQGELIKGRPGEPEQKRFHDELRAWAEAEQMPVFFFEAFDENWKGGDNPAEVEKHWGLYRADRSPKAAVAK